MTTDSTDKSTQKGPMTRRDLLSMIGMTAGTAAMVKAMDTLGYAQQSNFTGDINLEGNANGKTVAILGAGLAGMTAAYELAKVGYDVKILEYQKRAGGRCITLRGGDTIEEMGGHTQEVKFSEGQYFNPGPWRIPHHHKAVIHYCKQFDVPLQPFIQENQSAYLHSPDAFDGKPVRFADINSDYLGQISSLLANAVNQGGLDELVSDTDKTKLLDSLKAFGILNEDLEYSKSVAVSDYRGYERAPGGGVDGAPIANEPLSLDAVVSSGFWDHLREHNSYVHHAPMFQPVGGMDLIAKGFEKAIGDVITFGARVSKIQQSDDGVSITYSDVDSGNEQVMEADYCVCTIPFTVLSQIETDFSSGLQQSVDNMSYHGAFKAGIEMKRRFWEEDENIFGGITFTDMPIRQISYPSADMFSNGPGVLLGAYNFDTLSYQYNSLAPDERLRRVLVDGAKIHPQYKEEFDNGVTFSWHRMSWVLGCYGNWKTRENYEEAVKVDRRVVCAGEHLSYLPGWQEGAILSSLDAIERLHSQAMQSESA